MPNLPPDWPSTEEQRLRDRRGSRRILVIGGIALVVGTCLLLSGLALFKHFTRPRSLLGRPVLAERLMPDGTLLVLEKITTGITHQYKVEPPPTGLLGKWTTGGPPQTNP